MSAAGLIAALLAQSSLPPVTRADEARAAIAAPAQSSAESPAPLREADARVLNIADRIALAARPWCSALAPEPGWVLHHLAEYPRRLRADLVAIYALDRGPGIVAVASGGAAARAGLQPGDTMTELNGVPLTEGPLPGGESREPGTQIEKRIEDALRHGPAKLSILRGGNPMELTLAAPLACPTRVRIASAGSDNAFADGDYATFSARLVGEAHDDDELAMAVAHELAHNYLGHYTHHADGSDPRSARAREAEADVFALRLMAAAGYDPHAGVRLFQRLLDINPFELIGLGNHDAKGPRIAALRRELEKMNQDPAEPRWNGISIARPTRQ